MSSVLKETRLQPKQLNKCTEQLNKCFFALDLHSILICLFVTKLNALNESKYEFGVKNYCFGFFSTD